ncbi:hypothetical protein F5144DRAFT_565463 [Chaetomium tenue]|uniref:Uncharacterized protein n=1 Tax=Chaetomium tenue TaxID=1854479 RepID=A0ACB7PAJ5_9PEZI|nr:hypothetical protein F5144DRAFT_565463 [Chaetomium globosum]
MFPILPLGLLLTAGTPLARAAALPQLDNITIASISAEGTGCPQGTISTALSADRTTITFGFDEFHPYIGPGISPADKTKTCNIALTLSHPPEYGFEIVDTVYHGFARLDANLTAALRSSYTVTSDGAGNGTLQTKANIDGELVGVFTRTETVTEESGLASMCGRDKSQLQIATRATLTSRSSSTSGGWDDEPPFSLMVQQIRLRWSTCKE